MVPEGPDRVDFLRTALSEGQSIYHVPYPMHMPAGVTLPRTVGFGTPVTESEIQNAMNEGIVPSDFDISTLIPASSRTIERFYADGIGSPFSSSSTTTDSAPINSAPSPITNEPTLMPYEQDTNFKNAFKYVPPIPKDMKPGYDAEAYGDP